MIKIKRFTVISMFVFLNTSALFSQENNKAFLCAFMDGKAEDLRYCISTDGYHFTALNNGNSILKSALGGKIIRDPQILKDNNGVYHLVTTNAWKGRSIGIWDSKDLIHWENERLVIISPENADKTWAPEAIYNAKDKNYVFYWTSSLDSNTSSWSIYYATTEDFKTFSKAAILMHSDDIILDANIVNLSNEKFYMFYRYKDQIWRKESDALLGNYKDSLLVIDANVEGPFVYQSAAGKWNMVWDYYGGNQGRYGMAQSCDLSNWTWLTEKKAPYYNQLVSFPPGVRHGSIIPLTPAEMLTIQKEFQVIK